VIDFTGGIVAGHANTPDDPRADQCGWMRKDDQGSESANRRRRVGASMKD
jgi:hypothetical protein